MRTLATVGELIGRGSYGQVFEGTYNFGSKRKPKPWIVEM